MARDPALSGDETAHLTMTGRDARDRMRLDEALVARGLVDSRSRARDLILRGDVRIGGRPAVKPAQRVGDKDVLTLAQGAATYVSRGALKLVAALEAFRLDPRGRICLDVGASTGGFTQVLIERGAARVHAIENGRDQLHTQLREHPRVTSMEGIDARTLDVTHIPVCPTAIVADVSFISLTKALPAALALAGPGCWLVALVKPQFELGPGLVPRDGVVKNEALRRRALDTVSQWLSTEMGWTIVGSVASPIAGGAGNVEMLIGARRDG